MKKLSNEQMLELQGGGKPNYFACGAMVAWGVTGVILAAATPFTWLSAAGAIGAGAAMMDSAGNCVGANAYVVKRDDLYNVSAFRPI